MKQICPIHHFAYSGAKCPYCEKERIEELAHRFVKKHEEKPKKEKPKEITESDLKKLVNKFKNK